MFTFRRVVAILVLGVSPWLNSTTSGEDAVLIEFSSSHCGPCVAMQPIIAQLERSGVPVRHVDVMAESQLAKRFGIRSTPTFVVSVAGKEVTRPDRDANACRSPRSTRHQSFGSVDSNRLGLAATTP